MFIDSDFFNQFGMDSGPAAFWAVMVPVLVFVIPAVAMLGCLVVDLVRPGHRA